MKKIGSPVIVTLRRKMGAYYVWRGEPKIGTMISNEVFFFEREFQIKLKLEFYNKYATFTGFTVRGRKTISKIGRDIEGWSTLHTWTRLIGDKQEPVARLWFTSSSKKKKLWFTSHLIIELFLNSLLIIIIFSWNLVHKLCGGLRSQRHIEEGHAGMIHDMDSAGIKPCGTYSYYHVFFLVNSCYHMLKLLDESNMLD